MSEVKSEQLKPRVQDELPEAILGVCWSGSQKVSAIAVDGTVASYDAVSGHALSRRQLETMGCVCASGDPQGDLLAVGLQEARLVVLASTDLGVAWEYRFSGKSWVTHSVWSQDGAYLAVAVAKEIFLFSRNGTLLRAYEALPSNCTGLHFRRDEPELAVTCNGLVRTLRPEGLIPKRNFKWKSPLLCVAWSPDAKYIACGTQDGALHFWIVAKVKDFEMSGFPAKVRELSWHHSGKALAVGGGETITIWDFRSGPPVGKQPIVVEGHHNKVEVLSFARQSEELASVDADGVLLLWDPTVEHEQVLCREGSAGSALAWSDDDTLLAVGFQNGVLKVFSPEDLLLKSPA